MQRIFMSEPVQSDEVCVYGEEAHHLARVLRMRVGEEFVASDPSGLDYVCRISEINGELVRASVVRAEKNTAEPPYRVFLYQGMPKGDKTDFIIQKAVELGVYSVSFVVTERSVSRPDERSMEKKTERYQRISESAAAQSGRGYVPGVEFFCGFKNAVKKASDADVVLFCYEGGGDKLSSVLSKAKKQFGEDINIAVLIGPEGGFADAEVEFARASGFEFCTLGGRILRTETAGSHVLSCIAYEFENC